MKKKNNNQRVDVIILVYNDMVLCKRAIESALNQTYENIRLKILDNGSTDYTRDVIAEYQNDNRVELIFSKKNLKSEMATRVAMQSDSDYLCFLFSDDYYQNDKIEKQVKYLSENHGVDAVFSNNTFINEFGKEIKSIPPTQYAGDISLNTQDEHLRHFMYHGNTLHPCSMLIKSKTYQTLGGFKGYHHRIGDLIFFTKLLGSRKVGFLKDKLQNITVWTNERNQSALNVVSSIVSHERWVFLNLYTELPIFIRLPEIFDSNYDVKHDLNSDADRFWYYGHQLLKIKTAETQNFGIQCLYKAAEIDESRMNVKTLQSLGCSLGEYLENICCIEKESIIKVLYRKTRVLLRKSKVMRTIYQKTIKRYIE